MRATLILLWASLFVSPVSAAGAEADSCQVHVILFLPVGVSPPAGYQQRVDQIVNYAEAFFQTGFQRWKHANVVMPFRRKADGHVEVRVIRGKERTATYKPVTVRMEVMDVMRKENKLDGGRQVWWIMVYAGDPPARFSGFLGGFGPQIGGWAVCNFDTSPGRIDPKAPLASDFLERIALKGMLHELGHGFQLPHVGPLKSDNAGNTLMGPTHHHYRRVIPAGDERVYLSEAEAAMLSMHPAFRGLPDDRGQLPKVQVKNMKYTGKPRAGPIVVSGQVQSPQQRAVYALVADESDARPGEYWTKTYVGKVAADGTFEVIVSEPSPTKGTLKTWFAFENGAQTGDGKARGRDGGIAKAYTFSRKQWNFE